MGGNRTMNKYHELLKEVNSVPQESFGLKPDWFELSKLFSSRKFITELKSNFSKIFRNIGQMETGL